MEVQICRKLLTRLSAMDYELNGSFFIEQLVFPNKVQGKGNIKRISEQELRFLFIEEFRKDYPKLYYSIETPTQEKYKFGKSYSDIEVNKAGKSASLDMCIFDIVINNFERKLNIEFKHKNASIKIIGKDVLKLISEKQNGAFIHLLNNTDSGTFCNEKETGVFDKLYKSFSDFQEKWNNELKSIQLVIISLKQEILIHREIKKGDLNNLKSIFFIENGCGNIKSVNGNGWIFEKPIK